MPRMGRLRPEIKYFSPELVKKLECICRYPLTLLEASSGFGKTTALLHFSDTIRPECADIYRYEFIGNSLQEEWKQLCNLIGRFDKENGQKLLDAGVPDKDTIIHIRRILRRLSCEHETYLLLDDMQEWKMQHAGEFLSVLSEHGAENLHIVVATHPLSRGDHEKLIRSNRLWLLQEEDFAFSGEDAKCYFRQAGMPLSDEQLGEVIGLTEGWIMALYMQLDSLIRKGCFEQGGMEALMKKAFWDRLRPEEEKWLLELSHFPSFILSQAVFVSGLSAEKIGNQLREKHFFIRYDKEEACYYMHTQLKKLLKSKLMLLPEERQKEIYLKGGDAAFHAGDRINAFRFYYHAEAWDRILSMPFTSYQIVDNFDENTTPMILAVLAHTPYDIKIRYPKALVLLAFSLLFSGGNRAFMQYKDEIMELILESDFSEKEKNGLLGEMELLLSFQEYNRIGDMGRRHRRAWALLGGPANLIDVKSAWTFGSPSVVHLFWRESGKLDEAMIEMEECLPLYSQLTRGHGTGGEPVLRGEVCFHRGELEQAERFCYQGILTAEDKKQISIAQCGIFTLARIALLKGDRQMLEESRVAMKGLALQNREEDISRHTYALADGYLALLSGEPDRVEPWLAEGRINQRLLIMVSPFAYIVYGRVLIQKKQYQKLLGISEYAMSISSIFPNLLPQVYLKLYRAQAFYRLKNTVEAIAELKDAFEMALPDRIILPFVENYEGIKGLMADSGCPEVVGRKIQLFAQKLAQGVEKQRWGSTALTPREQEVLTLLEKGMTNKEISAELYISFSVVKKYVSSILKKFDVSTREMLKAGNLQK